MTPPQDELLEVFSCSLEHGQAVVQWPAKLSKADAEHLIAWLRLVTKRLRRKANA